MLKIGRRPYTACPFRWSLSTSGISTGEGDCSDAQCDELNGSFTLDFSACDSKSNKLVWAGDCEGGSGVDDSAVCGKYRLDVSGVSGFPCASTYNGSFVMKSYQPDATCGFCVYIAPKKSSSDNILNLSTCECDPDSSPTFERPASGIYNIGGAWHFFDDFALSCLVTDPLNLYPHTIPGGQYPVYERSGSLSSSVGSVVTFTLNTAIPASCGTWPSTITATRISSEGVTTGPETNDRIRSTWHLSYDIEAQLWTLRSFNRIDYPIYTLSDADPCTGYTKTLLLADKGSAADGCGVAPSEVTITRVCPPDRVGKSALLEDRKPNGATGKTKRQCGCDCQDEVDDRRHTCATKCTSTDDEGCGNINPAPDDITCRFPEAINCCEPTAGKDVPCAYVVEFECDLFFDIEDVRHKIAAKQVVMRRECYFENGCEFVAAGPESATGGSPVMDTDGYPGAQPVCSSCADPCLTGCTWDAWTVAACPPELNKCAIVAPVSRTMCLEFRWYYASTSGYTVGDVAAVLHYVSQTSSPDGRFNWLFKSDDGTWIANILPNTEVTCVAGSPPILACGYGDARWTAAPAGFPGTRNWEAQTDDGAITGPGPSACWSIKDNGIYFAHPEFGVDSTILRMYWIDCP